MTVNTRTADRLRSFIPSRLNAITLCLLLSGLLLACGNKDQASSAMSMPAMPVGVIRVEATNVPISAETVAQTEGAKEVEIRPRVGVINSFIKQQIVSEV